MTNIFGNAHSMVMIHFTDANNIAVLILKDPGVSREISYSMSKTFLITAAYPMSGILCTVYKKIGNRFNQILHTVAESGHK